MSKVTGLCYQAFKCYNHLLRVILAPQPREQYNIPSQVIPFAFRYNIMITK